MVFRHQDRGSPGQDRGFPAPGSLIKEIEKNKINNRGLVSEPYALL